MSRKHLYEAVYILSATLSEEARKRALEKITSEIESKEGKIEKVHDQGRKKLCYQIRGAREGHYFVLFFSAPSQAIKELWKGYHFNEDLLRYMTLRADRVQEVLEFKPLPE